VTPDGRLNDAAAVARQMERIRQEVRATRTGAAPSGAAEPQPAYVPFALQVPFVADPAGRYRLADLLAYHDETFVRVAYLALLGREPDAAGLAHHVAALRAGTSKVEILGRLLHSAEGRARDVHVAQLSWRYLLQRAYRVPVAGPVLQVAAAIFNGPAAIRNQRRFESHVMQLLDRLQGASAHAAATLQAEVRAAAHTTGEVDAKAQSALAAHAAVVASLQRQKADTSALEGVRRELAAIAARTVERAGFEAAMDALAARLEVLGQAVEQGHAALAADAASRAPQVDVEALRHKVVELFAMVKLARDEARAEVAAERARAAAAMAAVRADAARLVDDARDALQRALQSSARNEALVESEAARLADVVAKAQADSRDERAQATAVLHDLRASLADAASAWSRSARTLRHEALAQERRITQLASALPARLSEAMSSAAMAPMSGEASMALDAFYVRLEERFRGTRSEVKARQAVYLPHVQAAAAGTGAATVIDLGCGRGEWLEVVRDANLEGVGVDLNDVFVQSCTDAGLEAVRADAVGYLQGLAGDSVSVITSFHLIEHLRLDQLLALLDAAHRVLRPGGLLVLETPNPENLVVGACSFYLDPTHRHPLPPQLSRFMLEARGFANVEVLPLHPSDPEWLAGSTDRASLTINHFIYGPQDYGVLARKL